MAHTARAMSAADSITIKQRAARPASPLCLLPRGQSQPLTPFLLGSQEDVSVSMIRVATIRRFLAAPDRITLLCAIPVGLLGLMVVAGWILRLPVLIQILSGIVADDVQHRGWTHPRERRACWARKAIDDHGGLRSLVVGLGGLTLVEHLAARDSGWTSCCSRTGMVASPAGWVSIPPDAFALGLAVAFRRTRAARAASWCCRPQSCS